MRAIRRLLQVIALVGTLMVGVICLALIVSQTPWFRDWLRRYIVRESKQYVNGELAIGRLDGNLLFGVNLADVAIDVSGERIVSVKAVDLDYSALTLASTGLVLAGVTLDEPVLLIRRDADGWNLARLVKRQQKEADREGPGRTVSLPSIKIVNGTVTIEDRLASASYTLPRRIDALHLDSSFEYAPVHYTIGLERVSFRGGNPDLTLQQLTGKIAVREDNLYLTGMALKTPETSLTIDGVVERYLRTPSLNLTTSGKLSMPELGRIVPAASGYALHPDLTVKTKGPLNDIALNLDVHAEAGSVRGQVKADLQSPDFAVQGDVDVVRLNVAPILKDPTQRTDLTGHAKLDIAIKSTPAGTRALERMSGTYAFSGPHAVAFGYEVRDVRAFGRLDGRRIGVDGRGTAYGGTATARGFIVASAPGQPVAFDLRGKADRVNLRRLPASAGAPPVETNLAASDYHVQGAGGTTSGSATLKVSTVEGATIADGTTAEFSTTRGAITYSARGSATSLNLQRIGEAFEVAAIAKPEYDSVINGSFDLTGTQPRAAARAPRRRGEPAPSILSDLTLDATGTLRDSSLLGGTVAEMDFETHLDRGALTGRANGRFEDFDPARLTGRPQLEGKVSGTLNGTFGITDVVAPITVDVVSADGTLTLSASTVGGLQIDTAEVQGRYAAQNGVITALTVTGPDVKVEASGTLALGPTGQSNLKYHVDAIDVTELARLAGQADVAGTGTLDGTLTGNSAALTTTGTLIGNNLSYQENRALGVNSQYTVVVPDFDFAKARVQATSDATFVVVAGRELSSVKVTTTYDQQRLNFTTSIKEQSRELDATGQVVFHPDHQELHLPQLTLRTQGVEWRAAPGSEATIGYGRGRLDLKDVRLVSGAQALDLSGSIALGAEKPSGAIDVRARNLDIKQLETLLLQNRSMTGTLTADAKISGTTAAPVIDGHARIDKGTFQSYKFDSLDATMDYSGTRVGIDATLQQSATESITARGSVPTSLFTPSASGQHVPAAAGDSIDLRIQSSAIGLGMIEGITDLVTNVTGILQADVRVTGSGQDPHLNGFIDIKGGGFGVPMAGGTFTGLSTRIDLEPDRARIQRFELLDHHGEKLTVAGDLAMHERSLGAVNISIDSDNFEIVDNELGDVQVQAALKLTGELRRPRLVGQVRLDAGRIEVDRVLQLFYDPYALNALPDVVSAERLVEGSGSAEEATRNALADAGRSAANPGAVVPEAGPAPAGLFGALELDVRLIVPDNLVVRGKSLRPTGPTSTALGDINATVGGDVRILKASGGLIAPLGFVTAVRGTYQFQGRRFELVRGGTVRMIGTPLINPLLDLTATRLIPNTGVEARVHIGGTLQVPQLTLSSNPPLEESDILALIVFNRPVNELGTGERSSLAATAGGIATGFLAAPLGESIGKALDLDLFEITTTTDSGDLGAGIVLGQQLGDRAFVKLRQQFGERNVTEFSIEYHLSRFLRLQGTASPETTGSANRVNQRRVERAGIDLIFFFSY